MKHKHPNSTLALLALAFLLPLQPLAANPTRNQNPNQIPTDEIGYRVSTTPPLEVGKTYKTELIFQTVSFKIIDAGGRSGPGSLWIKVKIITGDKIKSELGEEIWLNLNNLDFIVEVKTESEDSARKKNEAPLREVAAPEDEHSTTEESEVPH